MLLNGVLRLKLLNIPLAARSFINLGFLVPHIAHFINNIDLPLVVFKNKSSEKFYIFGNFVTP